LRFINPTPQFCNSFSPLLNGILVSGGIMENTKTATTAKTNAETQSQTSPAPLVQMTEELVNFIIADAIKSPSGDNAQPWRFQWDGQRLLVLHAETLAAHSLNRNNHASQIALGALIEATRLSASQHGFSIKANLQLENKNDMAVWADIVFSFNNTPADPLASMISLRCTDRRAYKGGTLETELLAEIAQAQAQFPGCAVRIQTQQTSSFMKYFLNTEKLLWSNSKIVRDLGKWLRLSKKEVAKSPTGMSWKNIGISAPEALMFRLIRRFPRIPGFLWSLGFGLRIKQDAKKSIKSSAALVCFSATETTPEAFCNIGQLAFRTWLLLNAYGMGVQPLSYSSTTVADLAAGALSPESSQAERDLFRQGKGILQENFEMQNDEIPVWMFRTGASNTLPADYRALKQTAAAVRIQGNSQKQELPTAGTEARI
jgi:hypothetical protein